MSELLHASPLPSDPSGPEIDVIALLRPAALRWKTTVLIVFAAGAIGYATSFAVAPQFTAVNVFMPPQQQQNGGSSALASLGALAGLTGGGGKSSIDQYVSLMQSATVADRVVDKFNLMKVWGFKFKEDARKMLLKTVVITAGKRDGLITVAASDTDPARAAGIANQFVEELRTLSNGLAVTEAQQRRAFFEHLLQETRDKLAAAQQALEGSGFTAGALNTEPGSAAARYAALRAERTMAEVKLQVLRTKLADTAPEVRQQQEGVNALSLQLSKIESQDGNTSHSGDYIGRFREFKYQETLFDLYARQFEVARVDESREGGLFQSVDIATPPERKSSPRRAYYALAAACLGLVGSIVFFALYRRPDRTR